MDEVKMLLNRLINCMNGNFFDALAVVGDMKACLMKEIWKE